MSDHPDLNRFRERVEKSSEMHRSVIAPRDSTVHKDGMTPAERQRSVERAAAEIRHVMEGS